MIASGEHPHFVDLETTFAPLVHFVGVDLFESELARESVLSVGLLPFRSWGTNKRDGLDTTGLGGRRDQTIPHRSAMWADVGTDRMRLAKGFATLRPETNVPTLDGAEVDSYLFIDSIVAGFVRMYDLVVRHREMLTAPGGRFTRLKATTFESSCGRQTSTRGYWIAATIPTFSAMPSIGSGAAPCCGRHQERYRTHPRSCPQKKMT